MPRFFIDTIPDKNAIITGEDAKHIQKVLRMKVGEALVVCDKQGTDYFCEISGFDEGDVQLSVNDRAPSQSEPTVSVRLFQALPKGEKMDWIIQKAVELGVEEIVPVLTHRCVSRPDERSWKKKKERYNRIALEAAKQSGRGRIPQVTDLRSFSAAVTEMKQAQCPILFYEKSTAELKETLREPHQSFAVMIGAEGGFEEDEVAYASEQGIAILSLGKRILRCETAPLAALSVLMYATGNF